MYSVTIEFDCNDSYDKAKIRKIAGRHEEGSGFSLYTGTQDMSWYPTKKRSAIELFSRLSRLPKAIVHLIKG